MGLKTKTKRKKNRLEIRKEIRKEMSSAVHHIFSQKNELQTSPITMSLIFRQNS